ncbi:MAG: hypothetical protein PHD51_00885 [Patescibacteria group bacterium]|nr:hypothetical protein [Patescibacteria group bacterium]MDD5490582.1 hypothetical protein [Patescibacteria group bacterium]
MKEIKKVLLVEDNALSRRGIVSVIKIFAGAEVEVLEAASESAAKRLFKDNPDVDLMLVDGRLTSGGTEPDTIELVKLFRRDFSGPMVAISDQDSYNNLLLSAGCSHAIVKSTFFDKFEEFLENL